MTDTNQPAAKITDGAITATIWANETSEGRTRYSVDFSRSYQDNEKEWKQSRSFSGTELLRVGRLAQRAYDQILELKKASKNAPAGPSPDF